MQLEFQDMILLCEVDDPQRFGIAELDKDNPGKIKKIMEKPKDPPSNLAVIGIYFLAPKIFDIIDNLKPSWRGELEITEALDMLMNQGNKIEYDTVTGWWKDTGTPDDIIHANKLVLDSIGTDNQFLIEADAEIKDSIVIGKVFFPKIISCYLHEWFLHNTSGSMSISFVTFLV